MKTDEFKDYPMFRWFVMITMMIGFLAQGIITLAPIAIIGDVAKYLGTDPGTATFVMMGLVTPGICIGGLIGGAIVDRIGIAKMYAICAALSIVSTVLIPLVGTSIPALIVLRVLHGLACGPVMTSNPRMAAEWFPVKERSTVTGVEGFMIFFSAAVAFALIPSVYSTIKSFSILMVWMGLPAMVFLIFAFIIIFGAKAPGLKAQEHEDPQIAKRDFKLALKDPLIYLIIVYVFLFNWLLQGITDFAPGYFGIAAPVGVGFGAETAGKLMAIIQMVMMIGALTSGWLNTKVFRGNSRLQVMLAFILTGAFFFTKFAVVTGQGINPLLMINLVVVAFFLSQGLPTIMATIAKSYPEHITGKVGALAIGIGLIGGTVGVGVGSSALRATNTYQLSITIITIVAIIGFIVSIGMKKPKAFAHIHDAQSQKQQPLGKIGIIEPDPS